jgi:hypothetical protein
MTLVRKYTGILFLLYCIVFYYFTLYRVNTKVGRIWAHCSLMGYERYNFNSDKNKTNHCQYLSYIILGSSLLSS